MGHPRTGRRIRRLLSLTAAAYGLTWLGNRALRRVEGDSMAPTLWPDDLVLTVPAPRALRRGDVVVADAPPGQVTKRVVGLPGEDVLLQDGRLHVDGTWYDEPYAAPVDEEIRWHPGQGEVVLLGDRRSASTDSRDFGTLPRDAVSRLVVARLRPWRWLRGAGPVEHPGPRRRPTVRVIVLDPDDRVLLFRVRDVDGTEATWWETPGGGMQRGEEPLAAARRELAEELGHTGLTIVPLGRVDERETSARGARLVKVETLLAARVPSPELDTSGWTDAERRNHLEVRWFTADELAAVDLPVVPADTADLVAVAVDALGQAPPVG